MQDGTRFDGLEPGFDLPALPGMTADQVQTPCLVLDLDALERNIRKMGALARAMGVQHRVHGKMHKSVDVYRLQERLGGACGICCQKVSEAEVFVRAGVRDVMITNQIRDPQKIDRLARLPLMGARLLVCVDDLANVAELAHAARRHGTTLDCLVERDVGQGRCGVATAAQAVEIARAIAAAPGLRFAGLQAYHGSMQHLERQAEREACFATVLARVQETVAALMAAGLPCEIVGGGGTGSFALEGASGVYTEIQCGSYAFMDAAYGRVLDSDGQRLDRGAWENALFLLAGVMSTALPGQAVVDAGLKVVAVDSGLPEVFGHPELRYTGASDEHGVIADPQGVLRPGDRLRLVPGHCDPTCNLHDWYVGLRGGVVQEVWPVSARGKAY